MARAVATWKHAVGWVSRDVGSQCRSTTRRSAACCATVGMRMGLGAWAWACECVRYSVVTQTGETLVPSGFTSARGTLTVCIKDRAGSDTQMMPSQLATSTHTLAVLACARNEQRAVNVRLVPLAVVREDLGHVAEQHRLELPASTLLVSSRSSASPEASSSRSTRSTSRRFGRRKSSADP